MAHTTDNISRNSRHGTKSGDTTTDTRRRPAAIQPVPLLLHEPLYVGIDVGKASHLAGFVSATLLARHQRFEACPTLLFANSREGYRALYERLRALTPLEHVAVLREHTGHYHRSLAHTCRSWTCPFTSCRCSNGPRACSRPTAVTR